ncbi:hypothetical protein [Cohaesibacter celericrescens]|nr:hypothetical protein [Cohaesibacter celericrescens]
MFDSIDPGRDRLVDESSISPRKGRKTSRPSHHQASEDVLVILETGFRARVMSWRSAYELGARNGLPLGALRQRTEQCAHLIRAGLGCAVDETLFAALVYHYADLAKDLSRIDR